MPRIFPDLAVTSIIAKEHTRLNQAACYADILVDWGLYCGERTGDTARRNRIISAMFALAQDRHSDCILVFLDEAQNWGVHELTYFRDICNILDHFNLRPITILFGSPDILSQRDTLLQMKREDLVARFMMRPYAYNGIESLEDTIQLLKGYDDPDISEYPVGSGISYTQFFCPQAYRSGWRLSGEAAVCWAAFMRKCAQHHHNDCKVGMQWMAGAVRDVLLSHFECERQGRGLESSIWGNAVDASGFEWVHGVTTRAA